MLPLWQVVSQQAPETTGKPEVFSPVKGAAPSELSNLALWPANFLSLAENSFL